MRTLRDLRLFLILGVLYAATACGPSSNLAEATYLNVVDTATLYALRGTSVVLPSGYDVVNKLRARTDLAAFDFAFDIDPAGHAVVYPPGGLGLARGAGIGTTSLRFDSLPSAPETGYVDNAAVAISAGAVFVVRSRSDFTGCSFTSALPRYGKFRVLAIDPAVRSLVLETLVNQNCGYRNLQPGIPTT